MKKLALVLVFLGIGSTVVLPQSFECVEIQQEIGWAAIDLINLNQAIVEAGAAGDTNAVDELTDQAGDLAEWIHEAAHAAQEICDM